MFASDIEFSAAARFWWATTWRALPVYIVLGVLIYITEMSGPLRLLTDILMIAVQIGLIYYVRGQNNHGVDVTAPTWFDALYIWWSQFWRSILLMIPSGILIAILAMLSVSLFGKGWLTILLLTPASLVLLCLVSIISLRGALDSYR